MVKKKTLYIIAGSLWLAVGIMLLIFAWRWLRAYEGIYTWIFVSAGLALALVKYFLVFSRMADHNFARIEKMEDRAPVYKLYTAGTYILIFVMMALGILARKTSFPRACLASIDIAIGFGLLFGALRFFIRLKNRH